MNTPESVQQFCPPRNRTVQNSRSPENIRIVLRSNSAPPISTTRFSCVAADTNAVFAAVSTRSQPAPTQYSILPQAPARPASFRCAPHSRTDPDPTSPARQPGSFGAASTDAPRATTGSDSSIRASGRTDAPSATNAPTAPPGWSGSASAPRARPAMSAAVCPVCGTPVPWYPGTPSAWSASAATPAAAAWPVAPTALAAAFAASISSCAGAAPGPRAAPASSAAAHATAATVRIGCELPVRCFTCVPPAVPPGAGARPPGPVPPRARRSRARPPARCSP